MKEEPTIYSHSFYPINGIRVTITGEGKDFIYIDTLMKSAPELLEALKAHQQARTIAEQAQAEHLRNEAIKKATK